MHLAYFLRANLTKARYELPYRLTVLRSIADTVAQAFFVPLMPPPWGGITAQDRGEPRGPRTFRRVSLANTDPRVHVAMVPMETRWVAKSHQWAFRHHARRSRPYCGLGRSTRSRGVPVGSNFR